MTYKKVDRLVWLWAFAFMFTGAPGMVFTFMSLIPLSDYRTGQVVNRPLDWTMVAQGILLLGMSAWCFIRAQRYVRLRGKIHEAWEKKFEDLEFLLSFQETLFESTHEVLRILFQKRLNTPWNCGGNPPWLGSATFVLYHPEQFPIKDPVKFYKEFIVLLQNGWVEFVGHDLCIGRGVIQNAKKKYPLEDFETPLESNKSANQQILAT